MRGLFRWIRSRRALHRGLDQMEADLLEKIRLAEDGLRDRERQMDERFRMLAAEAAEEVKAERSQFAAQMAAKEAELTAARQQAALAGELLQAQREGLAALVTAFQLEQAANLISIDRVKAKG